VVLAVWAVLWCVLVSAPGGFSWFYFDHGSVLLFGGHPRGLTAAGGLHLYRNYPQYQIGPLTFLLAALIQPFGVVAAQLLMVGVGVAIVVATERLGRRTRRRPDRGPIAGRGVDVRAVVG